MSKQPCPNGLWVDDAEMVPLPSKPASCQCVMDFSKVCGQDVTAPAWFDRRGLVSLWDTLMLRDRDKRTIVPLTNLNNFVVNEHGMQKCPATLSGTTMPSQGKCALHIHIAMLCALPGDEV